MRDARSELVRVDDEGVAHPIGGVASQGMRARQGTFRLLPAPSHVVFMRFTDEDGRRDPEDGAVVRLSGEVTAPGALCDIFALVGHSGWRGELVVFESDTTRSILFEQGFVVGVQTNVPDERLGMVLYKFGALSDEQHALVMAKVREGKRFGVAAVELGVLKREQIFHYLARQIEEVVHHTLTVEDGTFFFLDGFDDSKLVARHSISANALLMDVVTRMDEMRYFRERIPSAEYVPYRLELSSQPPADYRYTYDAADGKKTVEEIGRTTGRGEFMTTKDVYALIQSKHLSLHLPRPSGGLSAVVSLANEVLRIAHREADAAGFGEDLRQNLASFTVGAGVYEILFRGAGPDETGLLEPNAVTDNVALVGHSDDPDRVLRQMLHDYVAFALFSAGAMLGQSKEAELSREAGPLVGRLLP